MALTGYMAIVFGLGVVLCLLLTSLQAVLAYRRLGGWEFLALAAVGVAAAGFVGYLTVVNP